MDNAQQIWYPLGMQVSSWWPRDNSPSKKLSFSTCKCNKLILTHKLIKSDSLHLNCLLLFSNGKLSVDKTIETYIPSHWERWKQRKINWIEMKRKFNLKPCEPIFEASEFGVPGVPDGEGAGAPEGEAAGELCNEKHNSF